MNYTKDYNNGKNIFVFGSNLSGIHGAGAARTAYEEWGAKYGIGVGKIGKSYAIPTKDYDIRTMPLSAIKPYVEEFVKYAVEHKEYQFLVTRIGCGLAGYRDEQIKPLFQNAPNNCVLPEEWS